MSGTPFIKLAYLGEHLQSTRKRTELARSLAEFLQELASDEIPAAVRLTIGRVFPEWDARALNVSWRTVMAVVNDLVDASPELRDSLSAQAIDGGEYVRSLLDSARRQPATPPPLTILEVFQTFEQIAETVGRGSRARKERLIRDLFGRATSLEVKYLAKVIFQEMRHGVSEGLMLEGIAQAASVKIRWVRRANQLWGDLGEVALVAVAEGEAGLRGATIRLFRPVKPMLAQTAEDLAGAFDRFQGRIALEYKLDGARVQIHRRDDEVHIYSRNLADVTRSLPDVVADIKRNLAGRNFVVEGEALAVDAKGRPLPFQHLMRRFRRKYDIHDLMTEVPVRLYLFDALYVDGVPLIDMPYEHRWASLEKLSPELLRVRRRIPAAIEEGQAFAEDAHRDGHEGIMIKDLSSAYSPGVRGRSWLKLKHVMSLDLVIVAAEWGYGRRHGWLSNYHLAVHDEETGQYLVVGKTFKGLTDAEFQAMTQRLLALERSRDRNTVRVSPKVVVEVLFNEIQESSQYGSGFALRFARITRLREDKLETQVDTLQTVEQLYTRQFRYKGRLD